MIKRSLKCSGCILSLGVIGLCILVRATAPVVEFVYHHQRAHELIDSSAVSNLSATYNYRLPQDQDFPLEAKQLLSQAVVHLERAVELLPNSDTYRKIGRLYLLLNQPEMALKAFSEALRRDPKSLLTRLELGFAYEQLVSDEHSTTIQWSLLPPIPPSEEWELPDLSASQHGWWSEIREVRRKTFPAKRIVLRASLPKEEAGLIFRVGITRQNGHVMITISDKLYKHQFLLRGLGWHVVYFDLSHQSGQIVEIVINLSSEHLTGVADIQFLPAGDMRCAIVQCLRQAQSIWESAGIERLSFAHVGSLIQSAGNYQEALRWYRRYSTEDPTAVFDVLPSDANQVLVIDSFVVLSGWHSCSWCGYPGEMVAEKGLLRLSFKQDDKVLQGAHALCMRRLAINGYSQLLMRVRGSSCALLTFEVVIDGQRLRKINYRPVFPEWEILTIPIQGSQIEEMLLGISEVQPDESCDQVLYVDWIGLK